MNLLDRIEEHAFCGCAKAHLPTDPCGNSIIRVERLQKILEAGDIIFITLSKEERIALLDIDEHYYDGDSEHECCHCELCDPCKSILKKLAEMVKAQEETTT